MRVKSFVRPIAGRLAAPLSGLVLTLLSASAHAQATAANFDSLRTFLQAFANFMTGPFGKAVVVVSIVAAFCTWVFAPKDGIFGPVLRVVVAGIAIMNAALWIAQFGGAGNITL
ncbi:TrbC/VirB2 family protein [Rhizobacter sp. SG703]|uniref:TrbC/VirB2 family protein n=1 Tax=Rhizobacter sp. SG703 TaxID=2587140 RepID=UPI0014451123|nr:TrbC/VirB2 family protein [Rhizobacter sp. SG703]NKI94835.1 type IV secretory pathway VirB2 component (pilin) [Rhizobacter sp. SG703]